jgi:hypothetical protein
VRTRINGWLVLWLVVALSGVVAQKWQLVTTLHTDASRDETLLTVDSGAGLVVDRDILLETGDGKVKETYRVKHAHSNSVLLYDRLRRDFPAGSRVYQ